MQNTKSINSKKSKLKLTKILVRSIIGLFGKLAKDYGLLDTFWAYALVVALNYITSRIFNSVEKNMDGVNPPDAIDKPPSSKHATKETSVKNEGKEKSEPSKPKA